MLLLIFGHAFSLLLIFDEFVIVWTFIGDHRLQFFRASPLRIERWFYAVARGRRNGIYDTYREAWPLCEGLKHWQMRRWKTKKEAKDFIEKVNPIPKCVTPPVFRPLSIPGPYALWSTGNPPRATDDRRFPVVFTDGSRKDGKAGAGVYWGEGAAGNCAFRMPVFSSVAAAELGAIVIALLTAVVQGYPRVLVCSDHYISVKSAIEWCFAWERNNWRKRESGQEIRNVHLVKDMARLCRASKCAVYFLKVNSRKGNKNWRNSDNKKADELAEEGRVKGHLFGKVRRALLRELKLVSS